MTQLTKNERAATLAALKAVLDKMGNEPGPDCLPDVAAVMKSVIRKVEAGSLFLLELEAEEKERADAIMKERGLSA